MTSREVIQFIIYPKLFHSVDFYKRGEYHISFRLYREDDNGNKLNACPFLLESFRSERSQAKKSRVNMQQALFSTQHFHVNFSEQSIAFNSLCVFTMEYQPKEVFKTVLKVALNLTETVANNHGEELQKQKRGPPLSSEPITLKKTIKTVQTRKIYLNLTTLSDTCKRVLFTEQMFFSHIDIYIAQIHDGFRIRKNDYQRNQFWSFSMEKKVQLSLQDKVQTPNMYKIGKKIKKIFESEDIWQFYRATVERTLNEYQKIVLLYGSFHHKLNSKGNSQKTALKYFPSLQYVKIPGKYRNTTYFLQYYEASRQPQLYYCILTQSYEILKNVRYAADTFKQLLLSMNQDCYSKFLKIDLCLQRQKTLEKLIRLNPKDISEKKASKKEFLQKRASYLRFAPLYEDRDKRHPCLTVHNYEEQGKEIMRQKSAHISLVIMVHGYQGSFIDLEKIRNYISVINSRCQFLLVKSIGSEMNGSISDLGRRVAEEVKSFLEDPSYDYDRISFIGYSLGGLICRAALTYLPELKDRVHMMITFATPHLGLTNLSNSLVKTGVWYMKKFENAETLIELSIPEESSEQSTLMKLSKSESLTWLKKLVVVSSKQDDFSPEYSSRISENHEHKEVNLISKNIRKRVSRLERVDVWFDSCNESTFDKILGRTAHIEFLDNDKFIETFFQLYAEQL